MYEGVRLWCVTTGTSRTLTLWAIYVNKLLDYTITYLIIDYSTYKKYPKVPNS